MDLMPNSGSRPYVIFAFLFFAVPLVLGPSMNAYLFALPPSRGFINSGNCSYKPSPSGPYTYKTCCWQDNSKGTLFTVPTYSCQRCKTSVGIIISCEQPEIQFRGGTIEPPSGGVLETQPGSSPPGKTITPNSGGIFNLIPPTVSNSSNGSQDNNNINLNNSN